VYGGLQLQAGRPVAGLAASLMSRGDRVVYSLYWLAWRLAFESSERITPVVTSGLAIDPRSDRNRYPPYLSRAARSPRWAYILPYDIHVPELLILLRRYHVAYNRWHWDNASVFDGAAGPNFPPMLPAGQELPRLPGIAAVVVGSGRRP
jgi:hypothetical protein